MMTRILLLFLVVAAVLPAQCRRWIFNPHTGKRDCALWKAWDSNGYVTYPGVAISPAGTTAARRLITNTAGALSVDGTWSAVPGGNVPAWTKYSLVKVANGAGSCSNSAVGAVAYTQGGAAPHNDGTSGGTYTGAVAAAFSVEIDAADATDTFKWNKDGGAYTAGVAITGAAQTLSDGVTITFAAVTGHEVGDKWDIATTAAGCWTVNGGTPVNATAGLTQDVVLAALPAKYFIHNASIKTVTLCSGATTIKTGLGTAADNVFLSAATFDLTAAVSATNFRDSTVRGRKTAATENAVASLVTTDLNVADIASGCAVDYWLETSTLP